MASQASSGLYSERKPSRPMFIPSTGIPESPTRFEVDRKVPSPPTLNTKPVSSERSDEERILYSLNPDETNLSDKRMNLPLVSAESSRVYIAIFICSRKNEFNLQN